MTWVPTVTEHFPKSGDQTPMFQSQFIYFNEIALETQRKNSRNLADWFYKSSRKVNSHLMKDYC